MGDKIVKSKNLCCQPVVFTRCSLLINGRSVNPISTRGGALCVQMDLKWTFEANAKCNNINHVWSHFYQILVVLKYHWHLWALYCTVPVCLINDYYFFNSHFSACYARNFFSDQVFLITKCLFNLEDESLMY